MIDTSRTAEFLNLKEHSIRSNTIGKVVNKGGNVPISAIKVKLSRSRQLYERQVPNFIDAAAYIGGFIDILYLIFGWVYIFFAGPFVDLYQAKAFS